jgi:hypothetical protein
LTFQKAVKIFVCRRPRLDRELNASLNIYLKMFPYIRNTPQVWVGVIPLKRVMNRAKPPTLMKPKG